MEFSWMPCGSTTLGIFTPHIIIFLLALNILRWYVGIPLLHKCSTLCDFIFGKLSEDIIQSSAILANVFWFTITGETQVHLGYTIRKDATAYRLWRPWFDWHWMTMLAMFWCCRPDIVSKDQFWSFVLEPDSHRLQVYIISRDLWIIVWSYLLKFGQNRFITVCYHRLNLLGHCFNNFGTCTRGTFTFTFHPVFCRFHKNVLVLKEVKMVEINISMVAPSTVVNIYSCCAWIPMFQTIHGLTIGRKVPGTSGNRYLWSEPYTWY